LVFSNLFSCSLTAEDCKLLNFMLLILVFSLVDVRHSNLGAVTGGSVGFYPYDSC
jgi:hypothetical protein